MIFKFGETIRKIRELRGYSQEYMAINLSISQRQYSRIERNNCDIQLSRLLAISDILEVSLQQILMFDEDFLLRSNNSSIKSKIDNYSIPQRISELYDQRIEHLEKEIEFLRRQLEGKSRN